MEAVSRSWQKLSTTNKTPYSPFSTWMICCEALCYINALANGLPSFSRVQVVLFQCASRLRHPPLPAYQTSNKRIPGCCPDSNATRNHFSPAEKTRIMVITNHSPGDTCSSPLTKRPYRKSFLLFERHQSVAEASQAQCSSTQV